MVRRVFFASFGGTVTVAVALGLALRGREPPQAPEPARPSLPVTVFTPGFKAADPGPGDFAEAGFAPVTQIFAETLTAGDEVPAAPIPLPRPTIALLTDSQVASELAVARSTLSGAPLVDLPPPPAPERANDEPPYDVAPQVRNALQIRQALEREYPIGLRETGIGGRVEMSFELDERGAVRRVEVMETSGHPALDQAALRVAEVFQFTPARLRNERVPSSIALGVTFDARVGTPSPAGTAVAATGREPATTEPPAPPAADQPVATPYDVAPQILNAAQVRQALEREYPIGLRAARIGGRVEVWFNIDEDGATQRFLVKQSSGNVALDEAALRVAQVFRFKPAERGGARIAVWVPLGITFQAR